MENKNATKEFNEELLNEYLSKLENANPENLSEIKEVAEKIKGLLVLLKLNKEEMKCQDSELKTKSNRSWNEESIKNEALRYKTRGEFYKKSAGAYNASKRLGVLDEVCSHMERVRNNWDEESIREEALKYKNRSEFQKKNKGAYDSARRRGVLDSVCKHMKGNKSWDEESIREEALKFKTRGEFSKKNGRAYHAARRLGILDSVCRHMKHDIKSWDEESIKKEALRFRTRSEYKKNK